MREGVITGLGCNEIRKERTVPRDIVQARVGHGFEGDVYAGLYRTVDSREDLLRATGAVKNETPMLNLRQVSIVSQEEKKTMATLLGLENIPFGVLSENMELEGIHPLTSLMPMSIIRIIGEEGYRLTSLLLTGENRPCIFPGEQIKKYVDPAFVPSKFVKAAMGIRGQMAIVLVDGEIRKGDRVEIYQPGEMPTK